LTSSGARSPVAAILLNVVNLVLLRTIPMKAHDLDVARAVLLK